jgi:putative ABC transport system ATP-binding protein
MLTVNNLSKLFKGKDHDIVVLQDIQFRIESGASAAIVGPSGSGKTTLLGLCAGLDQPTSGNILLKDHDLVQLDEDQRAMVRNQLVGFVFQNFQLLPSLTAVENVMVPLELRGAKNIRKRSLELLDRVGLADRSGHYPSQLSGGEQQRVAIARAFSNEPEILFADEPTGNLDEETSEKIEALLFEINKEENTTLILVTHDLELAKRTDRILKLKGGRIVADEWQSLKMQAR